MLRPGGSQSQQPDGAYLFIVCSIVSKTWTVFYSWGSLVLLTSHKSFLLFLFLSWPPFIPCPLDKILNLKVLIPRFFCRVFSPSQEARSKLNCVQTKTKVLENETWGCERHYILAERQQLFHWLKMPSNPWLSQTYFTVPQSAKCIHCHTSSMLTAVI